MGQEEKITVREADIGPVIARADHRDGAIEVNGGIFYRLPPLVQEFVLCHEVCHLKYDERDEARTNALASRLFVERASDEEDRKRREDFVSFMDGRDYSDFSWIALIPSFLKFGKTVVSGIQYRNAGWYSWSADVKRSNLDTMLSAAFEQSRRSGSKSAADFFWSYMQACDNKDGSVEEFLGRSGNEWVGLYIAKYEKKYGFGFKEVTPVDITAFPLAMVAVGLLVGFVVYKIIKKMKK